MSTTRNLSLGQFRELVRDLKPPRLTWDCPFSPLTVSIQMDNVSVILSASPFIALRSGENHVSLSHIQTIKRTTRHGKNAFMVVCNDYTSTNNPVPVEVLLQFPD